MINYQIQSLLNKKFSPLISPYCFSSSIAFFISIFLITLLFACDYITGNDIWLSPFYIFPIIISSYYCSNKIHITSVFIISTIALIVSFLGMVLPFQAKLFDIIFGFVSFLAMFIIFRVARKLYLKFEQKEKLLRAAMLRSERANQTRTAFFARVSHDLRQPLQALLMFVDELRHRSPPTLSDLTPKIVTSAEGLAELINGMLDMSAIVGGATEVNPMPVSVAYLIQQLEIRFKNMATAKGLTFRTSAANLSVYSDPVLLSRILDNLVTNAIRYTERGGVIIGCRRRNSRLLIQVWDSGIGIAAHHLDQVFDEYYQVPGAAQHGQGSGLGLAIVHRLCEKLGHGIDVKSRPGLGSVFTVDLPVCVGESKRIPSLKSESSDGNGEVVVLIDDEKYVLESIADALRRRNYFVIAADDAATALAELNASGSRPAVIIADYTLANGRTGPDSIATIRLCFPNLTIPALVLTGNLTIESVLPAKKDGWILLRKPVSPADIGRAINSMLRDHTVKANVT